MSSYLLVADVVDLNCSYNLKLLRNGQTIICPQVQIRLFRPNQELRLVTESSLNTLQI